MLYFGPNFSNTFSLLWDCIRLYPFSTTYYCRIHNQSLSWCDSRVGEPYYVGETSNILLLYVGHAHRASSICYTQTRALLALIAENTIVEKEKIDTGHRDRFFFHCRLRENLASRKQPTTAGGATAMWLEHFKSVI